MSRLLEATYRVEQTHFWFRGLTRFVRPLIEQAVAGRDRPEILDCGCGTGANMKMLSAFGRVTGFDITFAGPVFARTYAQTRLAQASVLAIPLADASFDFVTAFDVLQSLHDGEEPLALAEMRRVLKPGGFLMVNTAALPFLRGQHAVFGDEVRRSTRSQLRARLERAGFAVVRLTYTNFTLLPFMIPVRLTPAHHRSRIAGRDRRRHRRAAGGDQPRAHWTGGGRISGLALRQHADRKLTAGAGPQAVAAAATPRPYERPGRDAAPRACARIVEPPNVAAYGGKSDPRATPRPSETPCPDAPPRACAHRRPRPNVAAYGG